MFGLRFLTVFLAALATVSVTPVDAQNPCNFTIFQDGAPALADEVNCNFTTL
ncbi:MAG: hypothetical protein PVJ95_12605 [Cellvibrionales bacterium]|jgi:hypothetical protein